MQVIYNKDNINLNYLNNYVKFFYANETLHLYNTIYGKEVLLKGEEKLLKEFVDTLYGGCTNDRLIEVLSKISEKPKQLYEYLLQSFIVE